MLTPQLWIPFFAVIVVFFIIGNVANKQMKEQVSTKESIAIVDLDQSVLSKTSVETVKQIANVAEVPATNGSEIVSQMKSNKLNTGIIIPQGFQQNVNLTGKAQLETYTIMDNFSVLAGKKFAITDVATAAINDTVSNYLISSRTGVDNASSLKNPVSASSFVSANGKINQGNPTQILGYVLSQTTTIPVVFFVVIVMASQMIAAAVATEKENKTLETLLSLPISRKAIVISKMLSAGLVSLLMAAIYMFGIKSLNTGISGMMSNATTGEDTIQVAQQLGLKFTTVGFVELGVILFLAILLALAIAMILGAFAEDAKSAQGIVAPLMILIMIPYFLTMFMDVNALSPVIRYIIYAIPFSHIFLAMPNIMLDNHWAVTAGAVYMLILFIVFVALAAKIFSGDTILTMKLNFSKKKK